LGDLGVKEVAGIGAGAIAGIAIAGAAVVGLASFGGKKGYDVWKANRNKLEGGGASPIYDHGGRTGVNPLHVGA